MTILKQRRRTPWDAKAPDFLGAGTSSLLDAGSPLEPSRMRPIREEVFRLHGLYVFDPASVTSADFRQFMWAGLRFLRAQAKARGLPEEEVRRLLESAFHVFHDAADGMWTALKAVSSKDEPQPAGKRTNPPSEQVFVACEEDRLVPITVDLGKPLTLLDPDADLLSSFEP